MTTLLEELTERKRQYEADGQTETAAYRGLLHIINVVREESKRTPEPAPQQDDRS
jgi:hypothetical protein